MTKLTEMRKKALLHFGIDAQIDKAIEELDELKEALINYKADKTNKKKIEHVKEESADAENMIRQIDSYLKFAEAEKAFAMHNKMIRTMIRIESTTHI